MTLRALWCRWFGHRWGKAYHVGTNLTLYMQNGDPATRAKQCKRCHVVRPVTPRKRKGNYIDDSHSEISGL